jgi:hypothetical protein
MPPCVHPHLIVLVPFWLPHLKQPPSHRPPCFRCLPAGIFCCSLEGLRSMKAVRSRLGQTLKLPARSLQDLCEQMKIGYHQVRATLP